MSQKAKKNFLGGAAILTVALALVKVIGFIYKIPLTSILEGDGFGYYNDAYQVYSLLFVISTGGIPVAIAKMISESNAVGRINEPKKILSIALKAFSVIGIFGTLVLILGAKWFAEAVVKTPQSAISIIAVAPAIFFVSLGAAFKGYFQGYKNMAPTAVFQIIEALTKLLGFVVVFVLMAMGYSDRPDVLACGAILGVTLGSFTSTVYMFIRFYFGKEEIDVTVENPIENRSNGVLFRAMVKIAVPVTISASVMSITSLLDMIFVKNSLIASGLSAANANFVYGSYSGCCYSLFNLPPTITQTIGISVLPFISALFSQGKIKESHKNMDSSMRMVSIIAAPCAIGLSFFAKPILSLVYSGIPKEVAVAAPAFTILALGIYLVAVVYPTNLFLQACGKASIPMISMFVGAVLKIIINVVLVSNPSIRINGAPYGTLACYGSILIINLIMLYKHQKYRPQLLSVFVKPLTAAVISVGAARLVYNLLGGGKLLTLAAIGVAGVIYFVLILLFKTLNTFDVLLLPKGEKIANLLTRKGLIK